MKWLSLTKYSIPIKRRKKINDVFILLYVPELPDMFLTGKNFFFT